MKSEISIWKSCSSLSLTAVAGALDGGVFFLFLMKGLKSELQPPTFSVGRDTLFYGSIACFTVRRRRLVLGGSGPAGRTCT